MIRGNIFKRSFLDCKPVLKFPALRFHVTSKTLIRGVRNCLNDVEKGVESQNDSLISTQSNVNFLGIESEEGVITTGYKRNFTQEKRVKERLKEKFYRATFGVIRYDSDNKLKFHGQYGKTDDVFPRNNNEYSVVSGNLANVISSYDQMSNNFVVNRLDCSVTSSKICDDDINCSSGVLNEEGSDYNDSMKDSQSTSYIDQYYFNNSYKDRERSVENVSDRMPLSEELNFIDQNYFEDMTVSESKKLSQDQNFFQNTPFVKETDTECTDQRFLENLKSGDNEGIMLNSLQNTSKSLQKYKVRKDIIQDAVSSQANANISDKKNKSNINSKNIIKSQFKYKNIVGMKSDVYSINVNNNLLMDKNISKSKNSTVKLNEPSSHKANHDNYSKSVEPFASVKSPKDSKVSDDVSNMTSAYDFVQALKKQEKNVESDVKTGNRILDSKVDSKGFRILKNQANDLFYLTQDEIFNLLKQNILYSDDNLLILNKPYSLVMHESKTTKSPCLSTFLDKLAKEMTPQSDDPNLYTVHRLDKETTGCLLLARNERMSQHLKSLFAQRKIIKKYWILTSRVPDPPKGIIDIPIAEGSVGNKKRMVLHPEIPKDMPYSSHSKRGKPAVTSYEVVSESGNAALVEATPLTGIKHQIRVHFGFGLCCPIIGDHKYSHLDKLAPQKLPTDILQRLHVRQSKVRYIPLHIHAKSVTIPGYFEGRDLYVKAPLPNHMKENLKRLKFKK